MISVYRDPSRQRFRRHAAQPAPFISRMDAPITNEIVPALGTVTFPDEFSRPTSLTRLRPRYHAYASTRHILSFVFFSFVIYLAIGLPLATLPAYVHFAHGFQRHCWPAWSSAPNPSPRLSAGRGPAASPTAPAPKSPCCGAWPPAQRAADFCWLHRLLHRWPWLSFSAIIVSRLALGVGESLGSTGATLWGIASAGPAQTARVISYNGVSTFGGAGAGRAAGRGSSSSTGAWPRIGLLTILIWRVSFVLALRKPPSRRSSTASIFPSSMCSAAWFRTAWAWLSAAWATACWLRSSRSTTPAATGAARRCASPPSASAFIVRAPHFIHTIDRYGGFPVAIVCLSVESLGVLLLWRVARRVGRFLRARPWRASAIRWFFPRWEWKRCAACRCTIAAPRSASTRSSPMFLFSWSAPSPARSSASGATPARSSSRSLACSRRLGIVIVLWQLQHAAGAQPHVALNDGSRLSGFDRGKEATPWANHWVATTPLLSALGFDPHNP